MLRVLATGCLLLLSFSLHAATESVMSLLDNRFRVDSSIEQVTFVIYRADNSKPVVLVRPDGKKYYSWRNADNVRWYEESSMDIISIDNPMPGPWQAIGKVSPKNNIKLLSHLVLDANEFPDKLYQTERIKFTARLTSDGKPLVLRDFLERVKLKVTFTKFVENEESLVREARPVPVVMGEFADDGVDLDEKAGDGVFTVSLPIDIEPGKYRARITSGNGVFLRAQEQEVLVYPTPLTTTFIQSRKEGLPHTIVVSGEQGMIAPSSLAVHVEHKAPDEYVIYKQGQAEVDAMKVALELPYNGDLGIYNWSGMVYATDASSQRPLIFPITEQSYSVVEDIDLAESRRLQEEALAEQKRIATELMILQKREDDRQRSMIIIAVGNVVAILLGLLIWFVVRKVKAKKKALPEMQLKAPK
ncbi:MULTISPECIES: TIGR03503 family protein [unclassified Vibrio]|uniref:TIGR03503 family protein n=1 Tax=unclassified Vibrio TaxID=2614977 RepID=UPI000C83C7B5|nr:MULTISPECIES: TIGR03503 family protein [unclassified Vibrio]PMI21716.1 TIGR03503 family protein [Vibrio sp. 10N.286.46.E10]PMI98996.1 TIGR03503 family protein [Vibrio sp. 10N.286.45.E10]PTP00766.1 TIGR03503 family protein [Vibrio sp. 10N.286.45.A3]PTP15715.1 TIGR03503 family protein [Vibrio sp. 10N.286.51.C3]PTQ22628.1 TIGR03503 family protein [Vibrio sp. 10N.286.46.E10]